ncbi:hypothetical protein NR800_30595 [Corallococcus interemptor]|uniref:hypothetical protein n=1 Tax=Corallococcus TaxID=83461 RepID=UPI0035D4CC9E
MVDEGGFLVQFRMGSCDSAKADALLPMLKRMDLGWSGPVERCVVLLLRKRVESKRLNELVKVEAPVTNEVERLLGVP